jgi:hypothetical protein
VTYGTPEALRTALEARIRNESATSGLSPDRYVDASSPNGS